MPQKETNLWVVLFMQAFKIPISANVYIWSYLVLKSSIWLCTCTMIKILDNVHYIRAYNIFYDRVMQSS